MHTTILQLPNSIIQVQCSISPTLLYKPSSSGLEIGLEQVSYTVNEDDGTLTVCAEITSGELNRESVISFEMSTQPDVPLSAEVPGTFSDSIDT